MIVHTFLFHENSNKTNNIQSDHQHNVTFQILVLVLIVFGLKANSVDVGTVFIYGNIEEEIFMKCPPGMTVAENDVLALNKCIYVLVQAARLYHKKAIEVLCKIGFNGRQVDLCLFWKQYENDAVFATIYLWPIS